MVEGTGVTVTVSGLQGKLGEIALEPLHSVADLQAKAAKLVGPEVRFFRLVWGEKVLRDQTANFRTLVGGSATAEVTAVALTGPDQLSPEQMQQFKSKVDLEEKDLDLGFSLEELQYLSFAAFPGWLPKIYAEEPSSDCVPGPCCWSGLKAALDTMKGLSELDLTGNNIEDQEAMCELGEHLPRSLEVLRLPCPHTCMKGLASGIKPHNDYTDGTPRGPLAKLRELHFHFSLATKQGPGFVEALADCLPTLSSLETLALAGCNLRAQDLPSLAPAVPSGLKSLDLTLNFAYDDAEGGMLPELETFLRGLPGLREVRLTCKENSEASQARLRKSLPEGCEMNFEKQVAVPAPKLAPAVPAPKLAPSYHTKAGVPVRGFWASEAGEFRIFDDSITGQLSFEELIGDGSEKLLGRLEDIGKGADGCQRWKAELMILEADEAPWYGPSSGPKPEVVGDIMVTLRLKEDGSPELETRTKTEEDDEWQKPTFCRQVTD